MMYKAKVAICSDIRTKHSPQSEHHIEFLNVIPGGRSPDWALVPAKTGLRAEY